MGHILPFLPLSPNNHSVRFGTFRDGTLFLNCRLNDDVALSYSGKLTQTLSALISAEKGMKKKGGKFRSNFMSPLFLVNELTFISLVEQQVR